MPIQFNCSQCQSVLQIPDELAGRKCKCPTCGNVMPIPSPDSSTESFDEPLPVSAGEVDSPVNSSRSEFSSNPFASPVSSQPASHPYGDLKPHRGETILTFGIISLVSSFFSCGCCPFLVPLGVGFGIPAILMGRADMREMDENRMNPMGRGSTNAGMICGIIGSIIAGLAVALVAFQILMGIAGAAGG